MRKVFISYRRDDSADVAGRIYDRLRLHFGPDAIFMDVDNIPPGADFRRHIEQVLGQSAIVLVIIGPDWRGSRDAEGKCRLDSPHDFVRIEVEAALQADVPIVPVLVRGAKMPGDRDLPPSLASLSFLNAPEVRSGHDFHSHTDRLIRKLAENFAIESIDAVPRETAAIGDATTASEPIPGVCPICSRSNPPERQFCGGCGEPLHEACFECEASNGAWDEYCGKCGLELAVSRQRRIEQCEVTQREIEGLRTDYSHRRAIELLGEMVQLDHPRLRRFAHWARELLPAVKEESENLERKNAERLQAAQEEVKRFAFDQAIELLEQIPVPLRGDTVCSLLVTARQKEAKVAKTLSKLAKLRQGIETKMHDGTAFIEFHSTVQQIAALDNPRFQEYSDWAGDLHRKIAAAESRSAEQYAEAQRCASQFRFDKAIAVLKQIPTPCRTDHMKALQLRVESDAAELSDRTATLAKKQQEIETLFDEHRQSAASDSLQQIASIDHPRLQEFATWARSRLNRIGELDANYARKYAAARNLMSEHRFEEAIDQLEQVPEPCRTDEMNSLLGQARSRADELTECIAELGEKKQRIEALHKSQQYPEALNLLKEIVAIDNPGLVEFVSWAKKGLVEIQEEYELSEFRVEKLRESALHQFKNHHYEQAVTVLAQIPVLMRSEEVVSLLADSQAKAAELARLDKEIDRCVENERFDDFAQLVHRNYELRPFAALLSKRVGKWLDRVAVDAEGHRSEKQYEKAIEAVDLVPDAMRTDALLEVRRRALETLGELDVLRNKIEKADRAQEEALLITLLHRYQQLMPHDHAARERLQELILSTWEAARQCHNDQDHATAAKLLERIPAALRDDAMCRALADARGKAIYFDELVSKFGSSLVPPSKKPDFALLEEIVSLENHNHALERMAAEVVDPGAGSPLDRLRTLVKRKRFGANPHKMRDLPERLRTFINRFLCRDDLEEVWQVGGLANLTDFDRVTLGFSHDGASIAVGNGREVRLLDALTGQVRETQRFESTVKSLACSPTDDGIVVCTQEGTHLLGEGDCTLFGRNYGAWLEFSPDGRRFLLAGGEWEARLQVFDLRTRKRSHDFSCSTMFGRDRDLDRFNCATFSPDGKSIASVGRYRCGGIRIWDLEKKKLKQHLDEGSRVEGLIVSFSPDGKSLVVCSKPSYSEGARACVWDVESGRESSALPQFHSALCANFTCDGRRIVSVDNKGIVYLWDFQPRQEPLRHALPTHAFAAALSPDGRRLAIRTKDSLVVLKLPAPDPHLPGAAAVS